jgi:ferric-dicitrate binding protein FerR (iron transport regulator)
VQTSGTSGISVKTPTATISDKETNYTVIYDTSTKVTTVGVEEGKVEVTPANSSLQPNACVMTGGAGAPVTATAARRCPNPQSGKVIHSDKKFCTGCGARLNV